MKKPVLLSVLIAAFVMILPATALAVVPAFSLSEPTNNQKITNFLSVAGFSSNVDIVANCTIPNMAPYTTYSAGCQYTTRHVSVGYAIHPNMPEGSYNMS